MNLHFNGEKNRNPTSIDCSLHYRQEKKVQLCINTYVYACTYRYMYFKLLGLYYFFENTSIYCIAKINLIHLVFAIYCYNTIFVYLNIYIYIIKNLSDGVFFLCITIRFSRFINFILSSRTQKRFCSQRTCTCTWYFTLAFAVSHYLIHINNSLCNYYFDIRTNGPDLLVWSDCKQLLLAGATIWHPVYTAIIWSRRYPTIHPEHWSGSIQRV